MAFSVMASSSSALSSRVANNNNSALRKQTVSRKSASAFSCRAMSEAEIDAKYPVGGSVYKVRLSSSSSSSFLLFSAHTSLETMRLKIDIAKERERESGFQDKPSSLVNTFMLSNWIGRGLLLKKVGF